jgi:hypothetical protein
MTMLRISSKSPQCGNSGRKSNIKPITIKRFMVARKRYAIARKQQAALASDPNERAELVDQWHYHDSEFQECDKLVRSLTPQRPHPNVQKANYQDQEFYKREGANGAAAMNKMHDFLVARGWTPYAPATIEGARTGVQMYGKDSSISGLPPVQYDPGEQVPTRDEAAQMSGFKDYATLYAELRRQGRVK